MKFTKEEIEFLLTMLTETVPNLSVKVQDAKIFVAKLDSVVNKLQQMEQEQDDKS